MSTKTRADRDEEPGQPQPGTFDGALGLATASVACLAVAFAIIGAIAVDLRAGLGAGLGGAIAVVNLAVFARVVRGVLGQGTGSRLWALVGILKIIALFGGVWLVLRSDLVSPLSLIMGYGALPVGIALGGFLAPRAPVDGPESAPDDGDESAAIEAEGSRNGRK